MTGFSIHLPRHLLRRTTPDSPGFYGQLYRALTARGGEVGFCEREYIEAHEAFSPDQFHFVHQGLVRLPNALNTGPSYLPDFWYADPKGVFGDSSISGLRFDPETIPGHRAAKFHGWLRRRIVDRRLSKRSQPKDKHDFGTGHVAVFLQGHSLPVNRAAYMGEVDMVRELLAALPEHRILVKRHPRNDSALTWPVIEDMARGNLRLQLVEAHVHDMLERATLCCSISSSVSAEAMLFRVPVMVFGRTDYHHCVTTVRHVDEIAKGFEAARSTDWPFEAFLFWYFRGQCLDLKAKNWVDKLNDRLGAFRL